MRLYDAMLKAEAAKAVTKPAPLRNAVTKLPENNVTRGRPKVHASPAERQKAYRERLKAK